MFKEELTCARRVRRASLEPVLSVIDQLFWPSSDSPTESPPRMRFAEREIPKLRDFLRWRDRIERPAVVVVPAGAPSWITIELIRDTLDVWQSYYWERLTSEDALEILLNVGSIIGCLENSA